MTRGSVRTCPLHHRWRRSQDETAEAGMAMGRQSSDKQSIIDRVAASGVQMVPGLDHLHQGSDSARTPVLIPV